MGRPSPPAGAETILPFPEKIEPLRNVRSTIIIAGVANVKLWGRFDDYEKHIPQEHRATLLEAVAGGWVHVDAAFAHYRACEALGFAASEQAAFGKKSLERIGETMVGTAFRLARKAGATPWLLLPQIHRFWSRAYDGGGVAVYKIGPKDARLDLVDFSLCEFPFYRRALGAWVDGLVSLFSSRVFVKEGRAPDGPHSLSLRAQWV